jgi:hypothetical protein
MTSVPTSPIPAKIDGKKIRCNQDHGGCGTLLADTWGPGRVGTLPGWHLARPHVWALTQGAQKRQEALRSLSRGRPNIPTHLVREAREKLTADESGHIRATRMRSAYRPQPEERLSPLEVMSASDAFAYQTAGNDAVFTDPYGVVYVNHGDPGEMTIAWINLDQYGPITFICRRCHRENTVTAEDLASGQLTHYTSDS